MPFHARLVLVQDRDRFDLGGWVGGDMWAVGQVGVETGQGPALLSPSPTLYLMGRHGRQGMRLGKNRQHGKELSFA